MARAKQKVVGLVGHCGADASYLRIAVTGSSPEARVVALHDQHELSTAVESDELDLIMLNRRLDYGFEVSDGVELVRQIKSRRPQQRVMVISNFPEVQAAAEAAGALPGFGKREIGSAKVQERITAALARDEPAFSNSNAAK